MTEENKKIRIYKEEILPKVLAEADRLRQSKDWRDRKKSAKLYFDAHKKTGEFSYLEFAIDSTSKGVSDYHYFLLEEAYRITRNQKYIDKMREIIRSVGDVWPELPLKLFNLTQNTEDILLGIKTLQKNKNKLGDNPCIYHHKELGEMYGLLLNHTEDISWVDSMLKFIGKYEKCFKKNKDPNINRPDIIFSYKIDILGSATKEVKNEELRNRLLQNLESLIEEGGSLPTLYNNYVHIDPKILEFLFNSTRNIRYMEQLESYFGIDNVIKNAALGKGVYISSDENLRYKEEKCERLYALTGDRKYIDSWANVLINTRRYDDALEFLVKHNS